LQELMRHWKFTLAYDGTRFHGWQIQPNLPTIQGTLANALFELTGESVLPQGSGRTDTGVHALAQVASVSLATPIPPESLARVLNRRLPQSIRILSAEIVAADFHARKSAVRKSYEYRIFRPQPGSAAAPCTPFLAPWVWDSPWHFSLDAAQRAASHVVGKHDFSSFAASDPDLSERISGVTTSMTREIYSSDWTAEGNLFIYRVSGSGFLHHMVRNLVGTFADAAAGRIDPDDVVTILEGRNRALAGPTAPAQGLFLVSVDYPQQVREQPPC